MYDCFSLADWLAIKFDCSSIVLIVPMENWVTDFFKKM